MAKSTKSVGRLHGPKARTAADPESREALAKSTTKGSTAASEFSGAVRVARFEIGDIQGDSREVMSRWLELSHRIQQITNEYWKQWLLWHESNGSFAVVRDWYNATLAWHKADSAERGEKPKLSVKPIPSECSKHIYKVLTERYSDIHSRPLTLAVNSIGGLVRSRKAARGSLPGWAAIILSHEALPSSTRMLPIPFDKQNCPPSDWIAGENGEPIVRLRLDRQAPKKGKKVGTSTVDEFAVRTRTKKALNQRAILERVQSGEYDFKGSSIQYDSKKRKWYLLLCYQTPAKAHSALNPDLEAHLYAEDTHPWVLVVGDREIWINGTGGAVAAVRRQVMSQRASRQNNYHNAGSANKGHGRNRAMGPVFRLSRRWKDFVKTFNHTASAKVVQICLEHGIGTVVYHQPEGDFGSSRFLATAGKQKWVKDSSEWDWFQVGVMLKYKCSDHGLAVVVEKDKGDDEVAA